MYLIYVAHFYFLNIYETIFRRSCTNNTYIHTSFFEFDHLRIFLDGIARS